MNSLLQDLRYAVRTLLRSPGFAVVAILTLALGIGANTAIFSIVDAVLLQPLPYEEPGRLVRVVEYNRQEGIQHNPTTPRNLRALEERSQVFEGVVPYDEWRAVLSGAGEPERLDGAEVGADFFDVLGVRPHRGRFFVFEEDAPESVLRGVVLSHGLWTRRFGSDPAVVGSTVTLNGTPYDVVGVATPHFEDPQLSGDAWREPELWRVDPGSIDPAGQNMDMRSYSGIARLRSGVSLEAAQAEAERVMANLVADHPASNAGKAMLLVPIKESIVGGARTALLFFFAAVGLVLLIACVNVANLLLARATARGREIAIRTALGAHRTQIVRQLLTESVVLALLGGGAGVVIALLATDLLVAFSAEALPRAGEIGIDARVLGFTLGLSLLTGLVFGLVPALHTSDAGPASPLREGGRGGTSRLGGLRGALVAGEVALTLVLLVSAGLLLRSFWTLQEVDPGVRTEGVLALELDFPDWLYPEPEGLMQAQQRVLTEVDALPGVRAVGFTNILPMSGSFHDTRFTIAGRPPPEPGSGPGAQVRVASASYFASVGIPVLRGRGILPGDDASASPVVVVNQALARRYFPNENAIGQRISAFGEREIVGIVGDVRQSSLDTPAEPAVFFPIEQAPRWIRNNPVMTVRTSLDPAGVAASVRAAVWSVDDEIPISKVRPLAEVIGGTAASSRFRAILLTLFAAVALLLGATGIYGVVSYTVAQRTRELGIRSALGAGPGALLTLVIRQGMTPVVIGLVVGAAGALALGRLVSSLLFGIEPGDPATLATVVVLLASTALLAAYLPARRATRVDPMVALRAE